MRRIKRSYFIEQIDRGLYILSISFSIARSLSLSLGSEILNWRNVDVDPEEKGRSTKSPRIRRGRPLIMRSLLARGNWRAVARRQDGEFRREGSPGW